MINRFSDFNEKKDIQNLQDDMTLLKDADGYKKTKEPMELVQITGVITDEEEIKKIEENFMPDTKVSVSGDVKRGQTIWLTALLKKAGTSYTNQTLGVIKVRVVDIYYGLSKLNNVMK